ncbi:unnamed protein product [Trichogramma brassicae]|uniref:Endonuclease/exonuclease/phosphatase domain-containing protein n=1 Tax=Trichogramma brassicae TaxID=86971 RepID=A0A6H5I411_9HYME|nr:unnamed protein product [Trichogramma brassicae]
MLFKHTVSQDPSEDRLLGHEGSRRPLEDSVQNKLYEHVTADNEAHAPSFLVSDDILHTLAIQSLIFGVGAEGRIRASPVLPRGIYHLRRQALDLARSKRLPRPFMRGLKIFMRPGASQRPVHIRSVEDLSLLGSQTLNSQSRATASAESPSVANITSGSPQTHTDSSGSNRILSGTYDIVSVVETFLESSDNISPFHIAGYNFFHCHRRGKEGGGIGLYVREDLAVERLVATESMYNYTPEYQIISIKNSNNTKLLFATVYRSPEAGYPEEFFEVFCRIQPLYDNVIVTGDFNIHVNRPNDQHVGRLLKQLEQLSLHLVSTVPTHHVIYHDGSIHENCLDLVIVRDTSLIESFSRSSSPFAAAHDFIDFEYNLSKDIAPAVTRFTRDFRRVRTETFAPLVEREIDVGFSRDGLSLFVVDETEGGDRVVTRALLDLAVATLSSALLLAAADLVAPLSAPRPASRRKPWVTSQIRGLIRERDRVYRLFRRGGSSAAAYKELRSRVRNLLDTAKNRHLASRIAEAADMQSRWRALRSMGVSSPRLPSPLTSFSADELCSHYVAVGSRAPPLDISMATAAVPAERRTVLDFRHVVEDEVRLTMARCVAKGFGLDGISSTILRLSSPAIVRVMTRIV